MIAHSDLAFVIDSQGRERDVLIDDPGPTQDFASSFSSLLLSRIDQVLQFVKSRSTGWCGPRRSRRPALTVVVLVTGLLALATPARAGDVGDPVADGERRLDGRRLLGHPADGDSVRSEQHFLGTVPLGARIFPLVAGHAPGSGGQRGSGGGGHRWFGPGWSAAEPDSSASHRSPQSDDGGTSWGPVYFPRALAPLPDALAYQAAGPGGAVALTASGRAVEAPASLSSWSPLASATSLRRASPGCHVTGLDAVAVLPTGAPLVATGCAGRPGRHLHAVRRFVAVERIHAQAVTAHIHHHRTPPAGHRRDHDGSGGGHRCRAPGVGGAVAFRRTRRGRHRPRSCSSREGRSSPVRSSADGTLAVLLGTSVGQTA